MTKEGRLSIYHKAYEEIMQSGQTDIERDKALAQLMTEMEREFRIPILHKEAWEREHKAVIALYLIIEESRKTV